MSEISLSLAYDKEALNWLSGVLTPTDDQFKKSVDELYELIDEHVKEMKDLYNKRVHHLRFTQEGWANLEKGYSLYSSKKYLGFIFDQLLDSEDYLMLCFLGKSGLTDEEVISARSGEGCINLSLEKKPLVKQKLTGTGIPVKIRTL